MSPFLFAICMEYLSKCLQEMVSNPEFNFQPRCEKLNPTHLMFADDLLLFARADAISMQLLVTAFQEFSQASGLFANQHKSDAYFGGIDDTVQAELLHILGMVAGSIPFKCLGVPLSSKKLTVSQCRPLVERITSRIESWAARILSYAGRLQLIKSSLFGIQTY